jgi:hypothetical protein
MKSTTLPTVPVFVKKQGKTGMVVRRVLMGLGAVILVGAGTIAVASLQLNQAVAREIDEMFARSKGVQPGVFTEADLRGLPDPVQHWLRYSGVVGKEKVTAVRLKQRGQMRSTADRPWMPIEAEEYYTTDPPAFVWSATSKMAPFLWARVRDKNVGGSGNILVKAMGLITIEDRKGPHLDHDTLLRYLNEIMWFPSAAVSKYITWEPVDAHSAKATLTYQGITGSAVFYFDDQGRMTNMVAERYAGEDGGLVTWETPIRTYGAFNGLRLPAKGEAIYKLKSGDFSYGTMEITEIEYNVPMRY